MRTLTTTNRLRLLLSLTFAAAAIAGCGGTSGDTACADSAAARCAQRATCTNSVGITKVYGDMATCLAREKLSCTNALAAKGTGNTPDRVEQCVAALKTESCADYLSGNIPAACVNTGTLADAAGCAFAGQCSSTYCTGLTNAACGTCGEPVASGGDCTNGGTCARGQTCFTTPGSMGMAMSCITEGVAGASCTRSMPCAAGLSCVGMMTMGATGMCMPAGTAVGTACDPTSRTAPGCDRSVGLFCNATSKTCTAVTFAANGAACGVGSDGNLIDCTAGVCYGSVIGGAMPMMGTCKADAADGAACDTTNGPGCISPARCVTASGSTAGTCQLSDATKC
jgi:hypothetical protein